MSAHLGMVEARDGLVVTVEVDGVDGRDDDQLRTAPERVLTEDKVGEGRGQASRVLDHHLAGTQIKHARTLKREAQDREGS